MTDRPAPVSADEEAQARAYFAAASNGFFIPLGDWTGWGDGSATTAADAEGTYLIYTPDDELHLFDAVIQCRRHKTHRIGVTWPHQLNQARAATAACSAKAPAPVPNRPGTVKPTPLWVITSVADTPGADRQRTA